MDIVSREIFRSSVMPLFYCHFRQKLEKNFRKKRDMKMTEMTKRQSDAGAAPFPAYPVRNANKIQRVENVFTTSLLMHDSVQAPVKWRATRYTNRLYSYSRSLAFVIKNMMPEEDRYFQNNSALKIWYNNNSLFSLHHMTCLNNTDPALHNTYRQSPVK